MNRAQITDKWFTKKHEDWRYFKLDKNYFSELLKNNKVIQVSSNNLHHLNSDVSVKGFDSMFFRAPEDSFSFMNSALVSNKNTIVLEGLNNSSKFINLNIKEHNVTGVNQTYVVVKKNSSAEINLDLSVYGNNSLLTVEIRILVDDFSDIKINLLNNGKSNHLSVIRFFLQLGEKSSAKVFNLQSTDSLTRGEYSFNMNGFQSDLSYYQANILKNESFNESVIKVYHNTSESHSDINNISFLAGSASSVLNGLLNVKRNNKDCRAYQEARCYILSEKAYSVSYPQLEIENQEVACSHGSTMHSFDENQLFYLRSRGISERESKEIILKGHIDYFFREMSESVKKEFINQSYKRIESMDL